MTVEQVIMETIKLLMEINVPAGLKEQIADPIWGAIGNLKLCMNAFDKQRETEAKQQEAPAEEAEEEPVFAMEVGGEENG